MTRSPERSRPGGRIRRTAPVGAAFTSTSARSSGRSMPGAMPSAARSPSWPCCAAACRSSTRSMSGAVPGPGVRRRRSAARAVRARAARAARRAAGRPATDAPGDRTRSVPRGPGRLAGGPRAPRARAGRSDGRPRRRHDRAHPAGAVRRAPPDRRADLARPPGGRGSAGPRGSAPPASDDLAAGVVDGAGTVDVHGPICESTDELGGHVLPPLRRGDLLAIRDAGAYAAALASTYNGRPRPPQVILEPDGSLTLARRRGSAVALG